MDRNSLKLYELRSLSEMERARDSWIRLVRNSITATPFQTWEWNFGLAKFEGNRIRLRVVVVEDGNSQVVGIAPFCIRSAGWPGLTVLEFIGGGISDYLNVLSTQSHRDLFRQYIVDWVERNSEWRILCLRNLRRDWVDFFPDYVPLDIRPCDVCPYIVLPKTMEQYEATLPKQLRKIIDRKGRRLAGLAFSVCEAVSQLRADLPVFFDLHQQRQMSKGERGRFFDGRWREVFQEISEALLRSGFLKFGMLRIDGRPVAGLYNVRLHDREYFYYAAMDPSSAQFSPGSLLHHWMIGQAIKEGVGVYDFGRGNEPYKSWWTNETCQLVEVTRARSRLDACLWSKNQAWRRRIYRSRLVKRLYHAMVGRFQKFENEKDRVS